MKAENRVANRLYSIAYNDFNEDGICVEHGFEFEHFDTVFAVNYLDTGEKKVIWTMPLEDFLVKFEDHHTPFSRLVRELDDAIGYRVKRYFIEDFLASGEARKILKEREQDSWEEFIEHMSQEEYDQFYQNRLNYLMDT